MKIHATLTAEYLEEAVKDSMFGMGNPGFCLECGAERDGCEPDAENYECYECGAMAVMGAENIYMMVV